jgi:hypothetical protein
MTKSTGERKAIQERLQVVKAGGFDSQLGLIGVAAEGQSVAEKKRLARFCILSGKEALKVLGDLHEPEGGSLEAGLIVMTEKWASQAAGMTKKGANRAVEILLGLRDWDEARMETHLQRMSKEELEEVTLNVTVVMTRTTMALEEMAKKENWHATPTLL